MRSLKKSIVAATIVAGLLYSAPGHAAASAGGPLESVSSLLSSIWESISAPFAGDGNLAVVAPTPIHYVHGMRSKESDFRSLLDDAGYSLKEVVTDVGLIPGMEFEFVLARELTEADRDALERRLEIDSHKRTGWIAATQRQIVRTLLEASDVEGMRVGELKVAILPLPRAKFYMEPAEAPLGEEHDVLFRKLQELTKKMR